MFTTSYHSNTTTTFQQTILRFHPISFFKSNNNIWKYFSLPMTATDILYNLGFAASDTTVQVPPRFLGVTHANLGTSFY